MQEDWVLDVKANCDASGVAFFFKQWGGVRKDRTGRELKGRTWDAIPVGQRAGQDLGGADLRPITNGGSAPRADSVAEIITD
jgi:hypothetical protein